MQKKLHNLWIKSERERKQSEATHDAQAACMTRETLVMAGTRAGKMALGGSPGGWPITVQLFLLRFPHFFELAVFFLLHHSPDCRFHIFLAQSVSVWTEIIIDLNEHSSAIRPTAR